MKPLKALLFGLPACLIAASAAAAPTLRVQVDQRGDLLMIGNTLAQDCAAGIPAPVVGTIGACGANTADSAPDIFWQASDATSSAQANTGITMANAGSTAVLAVPNGATVTHAFLYWAAMQPAGVTTADTTATLARIGAGAFSQGVTAVDSKTVVYTGSTYYQSVADVTALVQQHGSGQYRVSGVNSENLIGLNNSVAFAAWTMVVFYDSASEPPRNLALFDGLDLVSGAAVNATLSGFLVPNAGFDAKLGVIAYEGDASLTGDELRFGKAPLGNADRLSDALNPVNNFFNGTRSRLGTAVSVAGDLPQLTGTAGSMSSFDIDIVDITSRVTGGQTSADIQATTTGDVYFLGAFITSISTFKPDFTTSTKTVTDVNGGALLHGDVLQYTIDVVNTGNDASVNTVLADPLPVGVTYVPGSLQIVSGPNAGVKTDATGDDQGEYTAGNRTVTVRLGTGANATQGGSLPIGGTTTVTFRVTVDASATGTIANQGEITAAGQLGAPQTNTPTDGNGNGSGAPPTTIVIDECATNAECPVAKPFCYTTPDPNVCVQCLTSANCSGNTPVCAPATHTCGPCTSDANCGGATPACRPTGACGQCSTTNTTQCTGATPLCDTTAGVCVACLTNANCSGTTPICNTTTHVCGPCTSDANCGGATPACRANGACGQCSATNSTLCTGATPVCNTTAGICVACTSDANCSGTTPVCNTATHVCGPCTSDANCGGATPACRPNGACGQCSATNSTACSGATPVCETTSGTCVACLSNANCGGNTPVCNATTHVCGPCGSDADCGGSAPACQASGACGQCSATNTSACTGSTPVCNTVGGICVACIGNSDCAGATPVCNPGTFTCVGCLLDGDCASTDFCNTQSNLCTPKLGNGTSIPTIANHDPALDGACTDPVGAAVCVAAVCDMADNRCGYANGDGPCTDTDGATVCRSAVCDTDDSNCGYANGHGPCTQANGGTVCRSGSCSVSGVCHVAGSCQVDGDCDSTQFCNTETNQCVPKLANNASVPAIANHAPALDGTCTGPVGTAVCVSAVCDVTDDKCGYANGDGPCSQADGPVVCRSGICSTAGVCRAPDTCNADTDCDTATQFCNTQTSLCVPKLANGTAVPTIAKHDPVLDGQCTPPVGTAVCTSAVCDDLDDKCGYANGDGTCTQADQTTVCRSEVCSTTDGKCGYPAGEGPCTSATSTTVCRSGLCSTGGVCLPSGACVVDADCSSSEFCNTETNLCTPKLGNGTPVPSIANHAPVLDGTCTAPAGQVVCASAVCDTADNECGYANGDGTCDQITGAVVCRSGACDPGDTKCGYANGNGPCTSVSAAQVCRSGVCSVLGVCEEAGSCLADGDCLADQFCNTQTHLCVPKLANDTAIPTISGHDPALDGTCTDPVGAAVCASALCDTADDKCGYANGDGPCTDANGTTVCRSAVCDTSDGKCGYLDGDGPCTTNGQCRNGLCNSGGVCGPEEQDAGPDAEAGAEAGADAQPEAASDAGDAQGGTGGSPADAASDATAGSGGTVATPPEDNVLEGGGCNCATTGSSETAGAWLSLLGALAAIGGWKLRRRANRR